METEHVLLDSGESQHVWRDREMPTDGEHAPSRLAKSQAGLPRSPSATRSSRLVAPGYVGPQPINKLTSRGDKYQTSCSIMDCCPVRNERSGLESVVLVRKAKAPRCDLEADHKKPWTASRFVPIDVIRHSVDFVLVLLSLFTTTCGTI
jgi:hypothetical protein